MQVLKATVLPLNTVLLLLAGRVRQLILPVFAFLPSFLPLFFMLMFIE